VAKQLVKIPIVELAVDQYHTPLVAYMFREYGLLPCSTDSHIGEYVPFAMEKATWHPTPVYFHQALMARLERTVNKYADGRSILPMHRMGRSAEEPFRLIESMWTNSARTLNAVNVPNHGYVPNLPDGAIVEVPAEVDAKGLAPQSMPPIHEPLAELMRTQVELQDLVVKAALAADPEPAFEAVRRDPLSPPDEAACHAMFDELRELQAAALPF
jgi:alpha-galactosidase